MRIFTPPSLINAKIGFGAKNRAEKKKDIKAADKIMRDSKNEFLAFSPNYARINYKCLKDKNSTRNARATELYNKVSTRYHRTIRDFEDNKCAPTDEILDKVKKHKLAHCYERALGTLAELYKNGCEAEITGIFYEIELTNKNTLETTILEDRIDHCAVLTAMGDKERSDFEDFVVIDPWLHYAGSVQNAEIKYKNFFENDIKAIERKICRKILAKGENIDDYELRGEIVYRPLIIANENIDKVRTYLK